MIGYPCFRFRITGHYFALVTLALSEVVRLLIVALRDWTGGSLGVTPRPALGRQLVSRSPPCSSPTGRSSSTSCSPSGWWAFGSGGWSIAAWRATAMLAISQEEDAAASVGINVTRTKLGITLISAAMTAMGGALYGQYQMYINPETVSGIAISLQIVFAVIAGGMFVQLGPTVGALITLLLAESLRVLVGHEVHGLDGTIYGLMLVLFIIYMPKGILGKILEVWERRRSGTPRPAACARPRRRSSPGTRVPLGPASRAFAREGCPSFSQSDTTLGPTWSTTRPASAQMGSLMFGRSHAAGKPAVRSPTSRTATGSGNVGSGEQS